MRCNSPFDNGSYHLGMIRMNRTNPQLRQASLEKRSELEKGIKRTGHTWKQLERIAQDRGDWRVIVGGLYALGGAKGQRRKKKILKT